MRHIVFRVFLSAIFLLAAASVFAGGVAEDSSVEAGVVNVYSHRHYDTDQLLFDEFTARTGIEVNVVLAGADELIERLRSEGSSSPADLLITVDASRLHRARQLGLLQPADSMLLEETVPAPLRDAEGYWFGLTQRARVIVYDKERTVPGVDSYEDLADPALGEKVLIRSSANIYNISLMSSIIAHLGEEAAAEWSRGLVANMAREPQGNDRDQMKALAAGIGDYAVVNTYYVGLLINSDDPAEQEVGRRMGIIFPNQDDRGTHVNISGAGVTAHAPNRENAIRLLEFLVSSDAQELYAAENHEYPVNVDVSWGDTVSSWGAFKADQLPLEAIGEANSRALVIFDQTGWK